MKKKPSKKEEIAAIKLTIQSIKDGWGADCPEYVPECESCRAKDVIMFLEEHLSYSKEELDESKKPRNKTLKVGDKTGFISRGDSVC